MKKLLPIILILLLLCSCTKQVSTDIYGFARRLNSTFPEPVIDENAYRCNENEYYFTVNESTLLTLAVNDEDTVESCELTAVKSSVENMSCQALYDVFLKMCVSLTLKDEAKINEILSENGLSPSSIDFTELTLSFCDDDIQFFVYSNSNIISLLCKIGQ